MKYFIYNKNKAQTTIEYIVLLGVVTIVFFFMTPLIKRTVQGFVRTVADKVGNQQASEQIADKSGYLVSQYSATRSKTDKLTKDRLGTFNYIFDDLADADTTTVLNLGFTPRVQ